MSTLLPIYALTAGDPGEDAGGVLQARLVQNLGPLGPLGLCEAPVLAHVAWEVLEVHHVDDFPVGALVVGPGVRVEDEAAHGVQPAQLHLRPHLCLLVFHLFQGAHRRTCGRLEF